MFKAFQYLLNETAISEFIVEMFLLFCVILQNLINTNELKENYTVLKIKLKYSKILLKNIKLSQYKRSFILFRIYKICVFQFRNANN